MQVVLLLILLLTLGLMGTCGAWLKPAFGWTGLLPAGVLGIATLLRIGKGFKFTPSALCLLSAALFAGYIAARAWTSPVAYIARFDLVSVLASFIVYVTVAVHVEHPKYRKWIVYLLALLVIGNFAIALYQSQYQPRWSQYAWLGFARTVSDRSGSGFFHNENHLAGFLELSVFPLLGFVLFARTKIWVRMILLFCFLMGCVTVMITLSRGGALAAGIELVAFFLVAMVLYTRFLGLQFWKYLIAFGTMFLLLGGFTVFLSWSILQKAYNSNFMADSSLRYAFWKMGLEQWHLNPVWGTGAQTYRHYSQMFTLTKADWNGAVDKAPVFAHNDYVQLLADYGAVGAALGLLLLGAHLGNGLRFLLWYRNVRYVRTGDSNSNSLALGVGCTVALIGLAAHSWLDFNLHIPANAMLMAALLGILANPGYDSDVKRSVRLPALKPTLTTLSVLAGGFLILNGIRWARAEWNFEKGLWISSDVNRDYLGATPFFKRAIELDPQNYNSYLELGSCYTGLAYEEQIPKLAVSWWAKAAEQFDQARRLYPQHAPAQLAFADALSSLGGNGPELAEPVYQQAIKLAPSIPRIRANYGWHLLRSGKIEDADKVFREAFAMGWFGEEALKVQTMLDQWRAAEPPPQPPNPTDPQPLNAPLPKPPDSDSPVPADTDPTPAAPPNAQPPASPNPPPAPPSQPK